MDKNFHKNFIIIFFFIKYKILIIILFKKDYKYFKIFIYSFFKIYKLYNLSVFDKIKIILNYKIY